MDNQTKNELFELIAQGLGTTALDSDMNEIERIVVAHPLLLLSKAHAELMAIYERLGYANSGLAEQIRHFTSQFPPVSHWPFDFKIIGTNEALQRFENECRARGFGVSAANSYFREDYGHCLIPVYSYDPEQPDNVKLQTLSEAVYFAQPVFDLKDDWDKALEMVEQINKKQ